MTGESKDSVESLKKVFNIKHFELGFIVRREKVTNLDIEVLQHFVVEVVQALGKKLTK